MRPSLTTASVLALGVGLAPAAGHAATATADALVDATLTITAPDSVTVSFDTAAADPQTNRTGSGDATAGGEVTEDSAEITINPFAGASAGPGIGTADSQSVRSSTVTLTNNDRDPVEVGLSLTGDLGAEASIDRPGLDTAASGAVLGLSSALSGDQVPIDESWSANAIAGADAEGDPFEGFETALSLGAFDTIDDLTVEGSASTRVSAIPVPAGLPLLLGGLGALAFLHRRRKG